MSTLAGETPLAESTAAFALDPAGGVPGEPTRVMSFTGEVSVCYDTVPLSSPRALPKSIARGFFLAPPGQTTAVPPNPCKRCQTLICGMNAVYNRKLRTAHLFTRIALDV